MPFWGALLGGLGGGGAAGAGAGLTGATTAGGLAAGAAKSGALQGLTVPNAAGLVSAGGGGVNAGGPLSNTGQPMPTSRTQQFDRFMATESPQAQGVEPSSDLMEKLKGGGRAGLGGLAGMDRRLGNVIYPGRSTNRWQPNENPGLSGLMRQLEYTYPRGLGRR